MILKMISYVSKALRWTPLGSAGWRHWASLLPIVSFLGTTWYFALFCKTWGKRWRMLYCYNYKISSRGDACAHTEINNSYIAFLNLSSAGNEVEIWTTQLTNRRISVSANNYLIEFAQCRDEICPLTGVLKILKGFVHGCHIVPVFGITQQLHLLSIHSPEWLLHTNVKHQACVCTWHLQWKMRQTKAF